MFAIELRKCIFVFPDDSNNNDNNDGGVGNGDGPVQIISQFGGKK